jgi:translation initiation factor 2B subunit (eIF-2B alpha/beta/delta family)
MNDAAGNAPGDSASWEAAVAALAADHLSPSSALAARASALLGEVARDAPTALPGIARAVAAAQPAMAALAVVANVALRALEALGAESVAPALAALQRGIDTDRKAAAAALCERVQRPVRVVTLSASASVVAAVQALQQRDLLLDVAIAESRPLLEGTALARWLADQGFEVTLVADASLAECLLPESIFVVGTDAILPHGIANKSGTRPVATWARLAGVPRYVLATRDKLYPQHLASHWSNPLRPPTELLQNVPEGLIVDNRPFDVTAREVWTEILVGSKTLAEAEAAGDHGLALGLQPLVQRDS